MPSGRSRSASGSPSGAPKPLWTPPGSAPDRPGSPQVLPGGLRIDFGLIAGRFLVNFDSIWVLGLPMPIQYASPSLALQTGMLGLPWVWPCPGCAHANSITPANSRPEPMPVQQACQGQFQCACANQPCVLHQECEQITCTTRCAMQCCWKATGAFYLF